MHLLKVVFVLQITLIQSDPHIKETVHVVKFALNQYKNSCRYRRNANTTCLGNIASSALSLLQKTERFGEFLKYLDVSDCGGGNQTKGYVKRHIFQALLINHDVPESHWLEFKVSAYTFYLYKVIKHQLIKYDSRGAKGLRGGDSTTASPNHLPPKVDPKIGKKIVEASGFFLNGYFI